MGKNQIFENNHLSLFVTLLSLFFLFPPAVQSQTGLVVGKTMSALKISDANNDPKVIPFVGEKVLLIQYTDPDVKDINDKLSDAVKAKKFDPGLYQGIGIANCKDTWIPNAGIRMKARQKEKQFAGSVVMLDEDHVVPKALGLGDCNGKGILMIVGKDRIIKYMKVVNTEDESMKATAEVIRLLEEEMKR